MHHMSTYISLQVIKAHLEIAHVNKLSFVFDIGLVSSDCNFCLKMVTMDDTLVKIFEFEAILYLW